MKLLKLNTLFILLIAISFTSCEKEETLTPASSDINKEIAEFESRLSTKNDSTDTDCSFDGLLEATIRIGHFVGVNEFPFQYGEGTTYTWSINGEEVTPRRPRFVRVNDHVSQPGNVEVCFSVASPNCDSIEECITIEFQG